MYSVEIKNKGGYLMKARANNYEFTIDTKGNGITPSDTLLASLASCIGVYIRKYAEGANIDIKGFTVIARSEFSKEKPVSFRNIKVGISLEGAEIDEKKKESLMRFIKNCPVHGTLKVSPDIQISMQGLP